MGKRGRSKNSWNTFNTPSTLATKKVLATTNNLAAGNNNNDNNDDDDDDNNNNNNSHNKNKTMDTDDSVKAKLSRSLACQ